MLRTVLLVCAALLVSAGCGGSSANGPAAHAADDDYTPEVRDREVRPDRATLLDGAAEISTGGVHSCARMASGRVYCWGNNEYGQLGDGTHDQHVAPVRVDGIDAVVETSAGHSHTCARMANGTLACWGMNTAGQLGSGNGHSQRDRPVPV